MMLGYVLAKNGDATRARAIPNRLVDAERERYVPPLAYGVIFATLGDTETGTRRAREGGGRTRRATGVAAGRRALAQCSRHAAPLSGGDADLELRQVGSLR